GRGVDRLDISDTTEDLCLRGQYGQGGQSAGVVDVAVGQHDELQLTDVGPRPLEGREDKADVSRLHQGVDDDDPFAPIDDEGPHVEGHFGRTGQARGNQEFGTGNEKAGDVAIFGRCHEFLAILPASGTGRVSNPGIDPASVVRPDPGNTVRPALTAQRPVRYTVRPGGSTTTVGPTGVAVADVLGAAQLLRIPDPGCED